MTSEILTGNSFKYCENSWPFCSAIFLRCPAAPAVPVNLRNVSLQGEAVRNCQKTLFFTAAAPASENIVATARQVHACRFGDSSF